MSSLTDLLTAAKNLAAAINSLGQTYLSIQGTKRSLAIAVVTATQVSIGQGRLVTVIVSATSGGAAVGTIYDSSSVSSLTNPVGIIPAVVGIYNFSIPINSGILLVLGTGMTVVVSYS